MKIDKKVEKLVKELNKVGLETINSCAGHKGSNAYISIKIECIKSIEIVPKKGIRIEWTRRNNS